MNRKSSTTNKGFTLIEVILVITIIAIFATVVLPRLTGRSKEARIGAAKLQIENLCLALDTFEMDTGRFPTTSEGLEALRTQPGALKNWKGPYLKKEVSADPWGNKYVFRSPGNYNKDYDLMSYGPDGVEGGNDDITSWTSNTPTASKD